MTIRGVALAVVLGAPVAWAVLAHPGGAGSYVAAGALLVLLAAVATGAALTRWAGAWMVPVLLGVEVLGALVAGLPSSVTSRLMGPPLDYANANAYLLLLLEAALLLVARRHPGRTAVVLRLVALGLVAACVLALAWASAIGGLLLLGWEAVRGRVRGRASLATAVVTVGGAVALTILAARWSDQLPDVVARALSVERLQLWREALQLARTAPVHGVGPGRFADLSPTAGSDTDLAWAHSAALQQLAEQGFVGLLLLSALVIGLLALLRDDAVLGAVLLLPATVDYVLDFPATLLALGAVLGAAAALSSGSGKPWLTPPSP